MDRTYRQAAGIFFRSAANLGRELREASLPGSRQGMFDWPEYSGKPDWQYAGFLIPAMSLFYQGVLCVVRGRLLQPLPRNNGSQVLVPVPSLEISREEFRRRLRILIREAGGIAGYLEKMSVDTGDHKPGTARED